MYTFEDQNKVCHDINETWLKKKQHWYRCKWKLHYSEDGKQMNMSIYIYVDQSHVKITWQTPYI